MHVLKIFFLLSVCAFSIMNSHAQLFPNKKKGLLKDVNLTVRKAGPYIGLQKGRYTVLELGMENQWKKAQLSGSKTQAVFTGFNYNFWRNTLGYDLGYWIKPNRLGLTFGGSLAFRTDFNESRVGIVPTVGYQLWWFHLQTGYHLLTKSSTDIQTNTFFVSLRATIINNRKVEVKKGNKKLFGK
jgi:hypothetical protein